jgi:putative ABC transport system substrate-binding protein
MRRRDVIILLGSAAAGWPLAAHAAGDVPVLGCLMNRSSNEAAFMLAPFRQGLTDTGYLEGRNLRIEYRWADGHNERLPTLAAELVGMKVDVIAALTGASAVLAAKKATTSIPIVFNMGGDAAELGVVANFNRPEGNLTGVSGVSASVVTKQVGLLGELVGKPAGLALLVNSRSPSSNRLESSAKEAAQTLGRDLDVVLVNDEGQLASTFATLAEHHIGGLAITSNALFQVQRDRIVTLAAKHRIPVIYYGRESADAGGLMSYSPNRLEIYRETGVYAGKILHGARPADLPILQPTKFELVINMKTAKALGLIIPPGVLAIADEVIE